MLGCFRGGAQNTVKFGRPPLTDAVNVESIDAAVRPGSPVRHASRSRELVARDVARRARRLSLHPGHPADDVSRAPLDDAPVCRVRHRRRVQPPVPVSAVAGRKRTERRFRPADPDGIRLGSPAGGRRSGPRRRRHRLDRGHGGAARRHSARSGHHVDDHQRDRDRPARTLRSRRAAPERAADGARRDDPERHPQGIPGARDLHLSAARVTAHRHRHLRVLRARAAAVEHHLDQRLSHTRSRVDGRPGDRVHARQRHCLCRGGGRRRSRRGPTRSAACRSSSTATAIFSRRSRSFAPRAGCGRTSCATASASRTRVPSSCGSTRRPPAARSPRSSPTTTSSALRSRPWPPSWAGRSRSIATAGTRRCHFQRKTPRASRFARSR